MKSQISLQSTTYLFGILFLSSIVFGGLTSEAKQPNFLFILVDDLGYADISPNNKSSFYETPNIQKLAESGVRFTDGYAACPVCSPTRASILTGKYPPRTLTTDYFCGSRKGKLLPAKYQCYLSLEEVTLAETLREAGYSTFFAGKWHLGPKGYWPEEQGFNENKGGFSRGGPYGGKKYFSPYGNPKLTDGPKGEHLPDRLATETVKFIKQKANEPFLAYLSFYSVHTPIIGRPDLVKKYELKQQLTKEINKDKVSWITEGKKRARQLQDHTTYAAMVEAMDQAVGKVLDSLDELKIANETIVVFFSDNGGLSTAEGSPTSNLPLRAGKGWMYEGGIRVPCLIRAPGLTKPGTICKEPVISTDFYPTMLDLAGIKLQPKQHQDGLSLKKLLDGTQTTLDRDAIYWHYPHYGNQGGSPASAMRSGDWKLIEWFEDNRIELYNLADDIGEQNNLAATNPQKAEALLNQLHEWHKKVGARMPTENPDYEELSTASPTLTNPTSNPNPENPANSKSSSSDAKVTPTL